MNRHKRILFLTAIIVSSLGTKAIVIRPDIVSMRKSRFNFSLLHFVDGRVNRSDTIGFTISGFFTTKQASLEFPANPCLFLDSLFESSGIRFGKKILLPVLSQITVTRLGKYSRIDLGLDFYEVSNDSASLFFSTNVNMPGYHNGGSINKLPFDIGKAFQKAFQNLQANISGRSEIFQLPKLSLTDLKENAASSNQLESEGYTREGIYFNCWQLINNVPFLSHSELLDLTDTSKSTIVFDEKTSFFNSNSCLAICRNGILYLRLSDHVYQEAIPRFGKSRIYFQYLSQEHLDPIFAVLGILTAVGMIFVLPPLAQMAGDIIIHLNSKFTPVYKYVDLRSGIIGVDPPPVIKNKTYSSLQL
jgi:hypothetical protein